MALLIVVLSILAGACITTTDSATERTSVVTERASVVSTTEAPQTEASTAPTGFRVSALAPTPGEGPLPEPVTAALARILSLQGIESVAEADLAIVVDQGDPRVAWELSDALRFAQRPDVRDELIVSVVELTGVRLEGNAWTSLVNHLIAWDTPAAPGYAERKQAMLGAIDGRWLRLFEGGDTIDWRHVSWGGVFIDDRVEGATAPCPLGCIPALDSPPVTTADGGAWYPDDAIVFGLVVNGEARAYPKNQMEVHEMVNDTLGGRRLGIPYCTLCGSAQAYLTDSVPDGFDRPVLRTSGLLIRSNKMMYDLVSGSLIDTFTGVATSGPLVQAGVALEQIAVVASTWGDWKSAHPLTTIVAEDGGLGRDYPLDPLGDRDDDGPIFPIGETDPRLPVHEKVLGLVDGEGQAYAVQVVAAAAAIATGQDVTVGPFAIILDGGLRAIDGDGNEVASHEAFWFAWSQFHPETELWPDP